MDQLDYIVQFILRDYYSHQHEVCLKIVLYIHRLMNDAYSNLIKGQVPTAANPQPTPQRPNYGAITTALVAGNIRSLVDLPEGLLNRRAAPVSTAPPPAGPSAVPAPRSPAPGPTPGPAPTPSPTAGSNARRPVQGDPSWNVQLREAWTAAGHQALFPSGAPFHRANAPPRNRVVLRRLAGDRSRTICLKMALTNVCMDNCSMYHGQLTPEEHQAIAREGGFQL